MNRHPWTRGLRAVAAAVGILLGGAPVVLLSGCSGGPVGASYEAERECWKAGRLEQRLSLRPDAGIDAGRPAMEAYEKILARYPLAAAAGDAEMRGSLARSRALAARRLAGLRFAAGQGARAGQILWDLREEARADPPSAVGLYSDLVQILARGGSSDSLAEVCRDMYEKLPPALPDGRPVVPVLQAPIGRIGAYASVGRTAEAAAAVADALAYYDRVGRDHQGTATEVVALMQKADVLTRDRRIPEAVAVLQQARSLPAVGEYAAGIGLVLGQLFEQPPADLGAAARVYREVLRDYPGKTATVQAGIRLAIVLASSGQPDSALAILDRVNRDCQRDPDGASQARFQKGLVLAGSGRVPEAIRELRSVAVDFPRTRAGLLAPLQVAGYYRADQDSLAMQAVLREAGQSYEQLIRDLRADPQQGPLVMQVMDRLAEARLRLRDWAGLAQLLQDRASAFPRDQRSPSALADAAQVLDQKMNDREGAIHVLQTLISRYPAHPLARGAQEKVTQLGGSSGS
jgi:tetratricopeptide (TPR) repeat protein